MFRVSLMSLSFFFIFCSFCGKDFKSLGRHAWRCKGKAKSRDKERNNVSTTGDSGYETSLPVVDTELPSSTCVSVKCSCGKICNDQRDLKMHQRSCRVIKELSGKTFENQRINDYLSTTESAPLINGQISIKVGVKLPKSDDQWKSANEYFQLLLPIHDIALEILIQPSFICIRLFTTTLNKILSGKIYKIIRTEKTPSLLKTQP